MNPATHKKHAPTVRLNVTPRGSGSASTIVTTPTVPRRALMEIDLRVRRTLRPSDLIGTVEAAKILEMTPRAVRKKIQRGQLPAVKIGGKYFLHPKAPMVYEKFRATKAGNNKNHS